MANDFVFESERDERRQHLKSILIPAAALVLIVLLVVAAALIVRIVRGEVHAGGEETEYPYKWSVGKNGTINLEIDRSAAPKSSWQLTRSDSSVLKVEASSKKSSKSSHFTMTPLSDGRALTAFQLQDADGVLHEISFLVEVHGGEESYEATLISSDICALQGVLTGGNDEGYSYKISSEDGYLLIEVSVPDMNDSAPWSCESSDTSIAAPAGTIMRSSSACAYVLPGGTSGSCTLTLKNSYLGVEVSVGCQADDNGALLAVSHEICITDPQQ